MSKIAILGSTGHIAKGLIENLSKEHELSLYSRSKNRPPGLFPYLPHDVIINCIGVKEKLWTEPYEIFRITEQFDNMILDHLQKYLDVLYINFSSGAVFGGPFDEPVNKNTRAVIDVNAMEGNAVSFYGIAKLNSEAKHRALPHLNIVDIRVFSYFSEYIRPDDLSIMNEILTCIREGRELATSPRDFYRDYIHPKDLARLVEKCIELHDVNAAFDAYSLLPVRKFELLDFFAREYGLQDDIERNFAETSPTGPKPNYYSNNTAAAALGYFPRYSSLDCIVEESKKILLTTKNARIAKRVE